MTRHRGLHTRSQRLVMAVAVAAAVAGIAVVGYLGWMWPPEPNGTAGAIGAVRKYRAPQIDNADVVLAGQESRVPYEAVLEDAVALQQVGMALARAGAATGADGTVATEVAAADERMAQRLDTIQARLVHGVRTQRAALGEFLTTHVALIPTSEDLAARLEAMAADEPTAETVALQGLVMELGRVLPTLEADGLAVVTTTLERVATLGDAGQPGDAELAAVTAQLEDAARALAVRDAGLDYAVLLARQRYLGLLTQELATLGAARREIEATRATMGGASADDVRGRLGALGTALGARAEQLANLGVGALQAQFGGMEVGMNDQVDALGPQYGAVEIGLNEQAQALGPQFGGMAAGLNEQAQALGPTHGAMAIGLNEQAQALGPTFVGMSVGLNEQTQALGPQYGGVEIGLNEQAQTLGPQFGGMAANALNRAQLEAAQQGLEAQIEALGPGTFAFFTLNTSRLEAIGTRLELMSLKASSRLLGLQTTLGAIAPLEQASSLGALATLGSMRSGLESQVEQFGNRLQP